MKVSFAYDKETSPVSRIASSNITSYPPEQYMALCQFTNIFWEYDREHNYAPVLVFEGDIERLDAIDHKFPHDIDAVYFTKNKPHIRFDYSFNDDQYATLASKGFWSGDGVHIPEIFTTSKLQLECFASVDEVANAYEKQNVPILNIQIEHPYENTFGIEQYDIAEFITREQPEESKTLENKTYQDFVPETNIEAEVEAAKAAAMAMAQQAQQSEYKPLTEAELDIRRKSSNVSSYVDDVRERLYGKRDEHNAAVEAEKARLAAEQALRDGTVVPEKDKDIVEFDDTPISKASTDEKLVETDDDNKYESNDAIFNPQDADSEKVPDKIAAFMQRLGINNEASESDDKKPADNKSDSDSGSGAASGAQGLGVYTFEDQSTAQFEMRQDEGVGNEKSDDKKDDKDDKKSDEKQDDKNDNRAAADNKSDVDMTHRKAQIASAIHDTTVTTESVSDERTK